MESLTTWIDSPYGGYSPGLVGVTPSGVQMRRHATSCRPGLWAVCVWLGNEVAALVPHAHQDTPAVMDDFGSLVGVPQ